MHDTLTDRPSGGGGHSFLRQGLLFDTGLGPHLYLANGSRVYGVTETFSRDYETLVETGDEAGLDALLAAHGLDAPLYIDDRPPPSFPPHAISLAVAQKCNLGCSYCYAQGGEFGGPARSMPEDIALAAVERLVRGVRPGARVNIAFLGGEPLTNRNVLRTATEHAVAIGAQCGVTVGFSITTNGTLLTLDDGAFFERHGFAVTISLDGIGDTHDSLRPFKGGRGSYRRIMENVEPILALQQNMQVSARVTVTPRNLRLFETLDHLVALGFHSVGFSPMLSSPSGKDEMQARDLAVLLEQMIACGRAFEAKLVAGKRYPFLNMLNALQEIHKGTHRPYPCGAGAGYVGVSAEGGLYACHRFVDDAKGALGSVQAGVDAAAQRDWMIRRHVHVQSPCSGCWARYLCGGGCHHEVVHRGRPACDYIRGWLEYCLAAYIRLLDAVPGFFARTPRHELGRMEPPAPARAEATR